VSEKYSTSAAANATPRIIALNNIRRITFLTLNPLAQYENTSPIYEKRLIGYVKGAWRSCISDLVTANAVQKSRFSFDAVLFRQAPRSSHGLRRHHYICTV